MHSFTGTGEFWLPGNEKNTFKGTLWFDPREGIRLDVIGDILACIPPGERGTTIPPTFDILHGEIWLSEAIKPITLYGEIMPTKGFFDFDSTKKNISHWEFRASVLLIGERLPLASMRFTKIESSFSYLFIKLWRFAKESFENSESHLPWKTKKLQNGVIEAITLYPEKERRTVQDHLGFQETTTWNFSIETIFTQEQDIYECLGHVEILRRFFILLLLEPVIPLSVTVQTTSGNSTQILYAPLGYQETPPRRESFDTPSVVVDKLENALETWLREQKKLQETLNPYFVAVYNLGAKYVQALEDQFLNLCKSFERYYEYCFPCKAKNRICFRNKLQKIYEKHKSFLNVLAFLNDTYRIQFIDKIVQMRNAIAHEGKWPNMQELFENLYRLRLFLELCFLGELDFTPEECQKIIRQAWYFERFQRIPSAP